MALSQETMEFFDQQVAPLTDGVRTVFTSLVEGVPADEVLGFALMTDPDGASLVAAAYTKADHEANLKKYSDPVYTADDPDFDWDLFLRWAPQEWERRSDGTGTDMGRVWDRVQAKRGVLEAEDESWWPSTPWQMGPFAMANLYEEGFLDAYPHAVQAFEITDEEMDDDQLLEWATMTNRPRDVESYRRWLDQENG